MFIWLFLLISKHHRITLPIMCRNSAKWLSITSKTPPPPNRLSFKRTLNKKSTCASPWHDNFIHGTLFQLLETQFNMYQCLELNAILWILLHHKMAEVFENFIFFLCAVSIQVVDVTLYIFLSFITLSNPWGFIITVPCSLIHSQKLVRHVYSLFPTFDLLNYFVYLCTRE